MGRLSPLPKITFVRDDSGVITRGGRDVEANDSGRPHVRRFGQVVRVRPDQVEAYERLHADPWPGVVAAIESANIRNYSIYRHGELLFAYFEYVGEDFTADMAAMAADPVIQEWWARTDAMQEPLPERAPGDWWLTIPEIFHTD